MGIVHWRSKSIEFSSHSNSVLTPYCFLSKEGGRGVRIHLYHTRRGLWNEQRVGISILSEHTQQGSSALGLDLSLTSTHLLTPASERCGEATSSPSLCSPLLFIFLSYPYHLSSPPFSLSALSSSPLPFLSPTHSSRHLFSPRPCSPQSLLPSRFVQKLIHFWRLKMGFCVFLNS